MKKIAYSLVLVSFSFTNLFAPILVANAQILSQDVPVGAFGSGSTSAAPNSSSNSNSNYSLTFVSTATTTWQKSVDQGLTYSESSTLKNTSPAIYNAAIFNNGVTVNNPSTNNTGYNSQQQIAVYLIPAASISGAMSSADSQSLTQALASAGTAPSISINNPLYTNQSNSYQDYQFNPSVFLYSNPTKWGYFVGYLSRNMQNLPSLISAGFAWVPEGQYYVYLAMGVTTYAVSSGSNQSSGMTRLYLNPSTFSVQTPTTAESSIQHYVQTVQVSAGTGANGQKTNGYVGPLPTEPPYETSPVPLPTTASRTVQVPVPGLNGHGTVNYSLTETDSIISAMSSSLVTVTPAPLPAIFITAPYGVGINWQQGVPHKVAWLANFKRANLNDTGLSQYNTLSVVPPYGVGIAYDHGGPADIYDTVPGRLEATFGEFAATTLITTMFPAINAGITISAIGISYTIPVVGIVIGAILSILDILGVFDSNATPFALPAVVTAIAYSTSTNTYGRSYTESTPGTTFIENGSAPVDVTGLPVGDYAFQVKVKLQNGTVISATSSPVYVLPYISNISVMSQTYVPNAAADSHDTTPGPLSNMEAFSTGQSVTVNWASDGVPKISIGLNQITGLSDAVVAQLQSRQYIQTAVGAHLNSNAMTAASVLSSIVSNVQGVSSLIVPSVASTSNTQQVIHITSAPITSLTSATGTNSFSWKIASSTATGFYAISVTDPSSGTVYFSPPFFIWNPSGIVVSRISENPITTSTITAAAFNSASNTGTRVTIFQLIGNWLQNLFGLR